LAVLGHRTNPGCNEIEDAHESDVALAVAEKLGETSIEETADDQKASIVDRCKVECLGNGFRAGQRVDAHLFSLKSISRDVDTELLGGEPIPTGQRGETWR
jgi:hypothetical protein